jgi:hypothetical protein
MQECKAERDCSNNGYCGQDGTCVCLDGWSGAACNSPSGTTDGEDASDSSAVCEWNETCNGHGRCAGEESVCECLEGWAGEGCDSCEAGRTGEACDEVMDMNKCMNEGRVDADGSCVCMEGYAGDLCGECAHGYSGSECEVVCETGTTCGENGRCGGDGECVCEAGYAGEMCDECVTGYGEECEESCDAERDCGGVSSSMSCVCL